jgi:hypothetical protein
LRVEGAKGFKGKRKRRRACHVVDSRLELVSSEEEFDEKVVKTERNLVAIVKSMKIQNR